MPLWIPSREEVEDQHHRIVVDRPGAAPSQRYERSCQSLPCSPSRTHGRAPSSSTRPALIIIGCDSPLLAPRDERDLVRGAEAGPVDTGGDPRPRGMGQTGDRTGVGVAGPEASATGRSGGGGGAGGSHQPRCRRLRGCAQRLDDGERSLGPPRTDILRRPRHRRRRPAARCGHPAVEPGRTPFRGDQGAGDGEPRHGHGRPHPPDLGGAHHDGHKARLLGIRAGTRPRQVGGGRRARSPSER